MFSRSPRDKKRDKVLNHCKETLKVKLKWQPTFLSQLKLQLSVLQEEGVRDKTTEPLALGLLWDICHWQHPSLSWSSSPIHTEYWILMHLHQNSSFIMKLVKYKEITRSESIFSVNVLSTTQQTIGQMFSSLNDKRFPLLPWARSKLSSKPGISRPTNTFQTPHSFSVICSH